MMGVDKAQVARQFSRAAPRYQLASEVQNQMADYLLDMLPEGVDSPERVIDLGCGAGYMTKALARRHPLSHLIGLDIAAGMLAASQQYFGGSDFLCSHPPSWLQADMESLPLESDSVDLIYSNASLQWTDFEQSLAEIKRILAPGGKAILATFVQGTLAEWHSALGLAGHRGLHSLQTMDELLAALSRSGLNLVQSDRRSYQIEHTSAQSLLESTKRMGATNAQVSRRKGLMGRGFYTNLITAIESEFAEQKYQSTYVAAFMVLEND
ncbi:MAG: methyltransferase domain-containing protein [Porticoccaceae bacterium]|jgi:malonyl-CoA O-methyltransferase|nr:methyltransferase domain-containing protein [Porticoccaceae bacterium]